LAVSTTHSGWRYDLNNSRLEARSNGIEAFRLTASTTGVDIRLLGDTPASNYLEFDASDPSLNFKGVTLDIGTSGDAESLAASAPRFNFHTTSSAATGSIASMSINQTMTGTSTANQVEALQVKLISNVKTGAWAQAIFAQTDYSTNGLAHGAGSVICAELSLPASSVTRGTYYVWQSEIDCPTNCAMNSNPIAVMSVSTWGGAVTQFDDVGLLFDVSGPTSGSGKFLYTNSIKMRISSTNKYLVYGDAEQGLHLGTSGSKNALVASTPYFSIYTTSSASTGAIQSGIISQTMTGTSTANQVEVLKVQLVSDVKTGAWAQAIFAQTDYSTNGLAHGAGSVICAELSLPASSVTRGTYYVWQSEIDCPTSCVMNSNPIAVMSVSVWGGAKTQFDDVGMLFDISGVTSGSGKFWYDNTSNAADEFIKVRTPSGIRYLILTDSTTFA